ncbi:MAG: isoprenyl transferase [Bacteroidales bacterium]
MISEIKSNINREMLPQHIAIIMDGNGRWAKQQGRERVYGHQGGVESVRSVIEGAGEIGIKFLTLYAFSTENWNRPKEEVDALMSLLVRSIHHELDNLMKNQVRLLTIGDMNALPDECRKELLDAIRITAHNTGVSVVLALSYSGRWEIVEMARKIAQQVKNNRLNPEEIQEETVIQNLNTDQIPDPDILIRTGGELRISNFLLWQLAYAEFFFPTKMWPDFRKEDLWQTIVDFQSRERRFGKTGEQVCSH